MKWSMLLRSWSNTKIRKSWTIIVGTIIGQYEEGINSRWRETKASPSRIVLKTGPLQTFVLALQVEVEDRALLRNPSLSSWNITSQPNMCGSACQPYFYSGWARADSTPRSRRSWWLCSQEKRWKHLQFWILVQEVVLSLLVALARYLAGSS